MSDLKIQAINAINIEKVLSSKKLTDSQKAEFINNNSIEIKQVMKNNITKEEFSHLMKNRPLIRFRPIRNSFTKKGDKILLAQSLGIEPTDVEKYIARIVESNFDLQKDVTPENIEKVKTYVFRHGKKDEVVAFLDYELSEPKKVLTRLYKVLDDNCDGIAGYFSRPIHRMDNKMLTRLYRVIDNRLKAGLNDGAYTPKKQAMATEWALVKLYQIQNNSKLIRASRIYENMK